MQRWILTGVAALAGCGAVAPLDAPRRWDFQGDEPGGPAGGLVVLHDDDGPIGRWEVRKDVAGAPSPRYVLGQVATHQTRPGGCFALADTAPVADVRARVHCTPHAEGPARGAGLVFRHRADGTHYCARWDVARQQLLLERVVGTARTALARAPVDVIDLAAKPWHVIVVAARGARLAVAFDDHPIIDVVDPAPLGAGQVGCWTPSGAVTSFDDLSVEPLGAPSPAGGPADAPAGR